MLCSSLFYWLALPQLDVRREYPDGRSEQVHLPLKLRSESATLRISIRQVFSFPEVFRFFGDDCIDEIEVNGRKLQKGDEWCNWLYGFEVNLSEYSKTLENQLVIKTTDRDGQGGVDFQVSRTGSFYLLQQANLIICLSILVLLILQSFNVDVYESVILALAAGVRVRYFFATSPHIRAYDAPAHIDYVKQVSETWAMPGLLTGCETHQPPLYYFIAAPFWKLEAALGGPLKTVLRNVQALSCMLSIASLGILLLIAKELFDEKSPSRRLFLAFLAFAPSYIFLSSRITNDALSQPLSLLLVYLILRWWNGTEGAWKQILVVIPAAILTKLTGIVFALITGLLVLAGRYSLKVKFKLLLQLSLSIVILCGWYFYERIVVERQSNIAGPMQCMDDALKVPRNVSGLITFNPIAVVQLPFVNTRMDGFRRENFPEFFFRSAFFGEYSFSEIYRPAAKAILVSALFLLICVFIGVIHRLFRNPGVRALVPLFLIFLIPIGLQIAAFWKAPYSCQQDFRFFPFILVPICYFCVEGINFMPRQVRFLFSSIAWLHVLCCVVFFVGAPFYE